MALMHQAEKIAIDDDAWIPIYYYVSKALVSQKLAGLRRQHQAHPPLALDGARGLGRWAAHLARRLAIGVPTLLIIITLSFFMMRLAPGGPFDQERPIPPEILRNIERAYHLDEPLWQQYLRYLGGVAARRLRAVLPDQGLHRQPTAGRGRSGQLQGRRAGGAAGRSLLGLAAGIVAALRQNSWVDYSVMALAMVGIAIPSFVMAPLLTLIFGVYLGWLPAGGWGGGAPLFLILPVVSLALPQVARVARLARGAMIEQLHANYVRTARAKGLRERLVAAAPRAAGRDAAGGLLSRADDRGPADRLGGDRDHLQHSRASAATSCRGR